MTSKKTYKKTIFREYLALAFHVILFVSMLFMTIQNIIDEVVWMTIISSVTTVIWGYFALEDIKQISSAKGAIAAIKAIEAEQQNEASEGN